MQSDEKQHECVYKWENKMCRSVKLQIGQIELQRKYLTACKTVGVSWICLLPKYLKYRVTANKRDK